MNLISNFLMNLLVTTVTGTVFFLTWRVLKRLFRGKDARLTYHILKVSLVFYLIPFVYLICLLQTGINEITFFREGITYFTYVCEDYTEIIFILLTLYLLILVTNAIAIEIRTLKWKSILKGNVEEHRDEIISLFQEIVQELGVVKRVRLRRNDSIVTPCVYGIIHPTVLLPIRDYSRKDYEIIFSHELYHLKRKDIRTKLLTRMALILNCFNPLIYFLNREIEYWSESSCDSGVCDYCSHRFTKTEYFRTILSDSEWRSEKKRYILSALFESTSLLERRVNQMKKGRNKKSFRRVSALVIFTAYFFSNVMLCGATGLGAAELLSGTNEGRIEGQEEFERTVSRELIMMLADTAFVHQADTETRSSVTNIDWTLPANEDYSTASRWMTKGDSIHVNLLLSVSTGECRVGIVEPDLIFRYMNVSSVMTHAFDIDKNGWHCLRVENSYDCSLDVDGNVIWSR